MKVIVVKTYDEMSREAFSVMKEVVTANPRAVLGLATGSTPIGLYQNMIADHEKTARAIAGSAPSIWTSMRGWMSPAIRVISISCGTICSTTST